MVMSILIIELFYKIAYIPAYFKSFGVPEFKWIQWHSFAKLG